MSYPFEIPTAPGTEVAVPERFGRLPDLAYNMWWTWAAGGRQLWQRISPADWARSPNPLTVLQTAPPEAWEHLATDPDFGALYDDVVARFDRYMAADPGPDGLGGGVAYLCAEFGVDQTLPFYSGGLGVLAGDHLKSASDAALPLVAVGLLYRRGFFRQAVDPDGLQQHHFRPIEVTRRGARRVLDGDGQPLTVQVPLPSGPVDVAVWRIDVGRVPLLLLDTDLPSNDPADRPITHILYVRGREMRLTQELVLGVGAVRALRALGVDPSVWHVNEGHAGFSLVERLRESGGPFEGAAAAIRRSTVFTLHTPVPAGNEIFDAGMVRVRLAALGDGLDVDRVMAMGSTPRQEGMFDLGALAIRLSSSTNGVSQRHGEVVSEEWGDVIGGPAASITNGVHLPTWVGPSMARRFASAVGPDWAARGDDPAAWDAVRAVDDSDIWDAHLAQKAQMLRSLRARIREQRARHGAAPDQLRAVTRLLPDDRLTIVFARRFATYKRAGLVLRDVDRLRRILTDPDRPAQMVFAGKAHPADQGGKDLIRTVFEMSTSEHFAGHVFYIEDYDIDVARHLVGGADVWLNLPTPPREASGTSGMKAAVNGGLNVSVLDGWWLEGFTGDNGWAIGGGPHDDHSDGADASALYALLEDEVVPTFYAASADGIPTHWVRRMKESIATTAGRFGARRMVQQYADLYRSRAGEQDG
jgi:starch phosphorylase